MSIRKYFVLGIVLVVCLFTRNAVFAGEKHNSCEYWKNQIKKVEREIEAEEEYQRIIRSSFNEQEPVEPSVEDEVNQMDHLSEEDKKFFIEVLKGDPEEERRVESIISETMNEIEEDTQLEMRHLHKKLRKAKAMLGKCG